MIRAASEGGPEPMRYFISVLLVIVVGCSSPAEPEDGRSVGMISGFWEDNPGFWEGDPWIQVTTNGFAVSVTVMTFGNGCLSRGDTDIRVEGLTATITPYDNHPTGLSVCTTELKIMQHNAEFQFAEPGVAQITVRGLAHPDRDMISAVGSIEVPGTSTLCLDTCPPEWAFESAEL